MISSLSFADYEKYEEPEYEKAVKKISTKIYLAEDDALKNFLNEEKKIKNADISRKSNDLLRFNT